MSSPRPGAKTDAYGWAWHSRAVAGSRPVGHGGQNHPRRCRLLIVAYHWSLTMALDDVSELVQQAGQLKGIGKRIDR